jgi:hypothetical protein
MSEVSMSLSAIAAISAARFLEIGIEQAAAQRGNRN